MSSYIEEGAISIIILVAIEGGLHQWMSLGSYVGRVQIATGGMMGIAH